MSAEVITGIISAAVAFVTLSGGVIYGYGRLVMRVGNVEKRQATDTRDLTKKLEAKADLGQFTNLHTDVREIRDMLLVLMQRPPGCPHTVDRHHD